MFTVCVFQFYGFLQVHNVMYLTLSYSPITLKISCSNFSLFIFPISLPYLKLLATTAAFTLYSFTFSKSRIVRTKQTFSDCLLSLSNVNLTFSMSFCSLIFHLFLSLNNILLYGCTTVYSNWRTSWMLPVLTVINEPCYIYSCAKFSVDISFHLIWVNRNVIARITW